MDDADAAWIFPLLMLLLLPSVAVSVIRAAAAGAMGRNGAIGIRTRSTQSSDAAWTAGHQSALAPALRTRWIAVAAVPSALAAQFLFHGPAGTIVALAGLLLQAAVLICAAKAANAAARAVG